MKSELIVTGSIERFLDHVPEKWFKFAPVPLDVTAEEYEHEYRLFLVHDPLVAKMLGADRFVLRITPHIEQEFWAMPEQTIFVQSHTVTTQALRDEITGTIASAVGVIVQGASDDVIKYATAITDALVVAQAEVDLTKRDALVKELLAQLGLLAELNRVRATETGFETLRMLLSTSSGILSGVLAAFGQGLGAAAAAGVSHALGGPKNPATGG